MAGVCVCDGDCVEERSLLWVSEFSDSLCFTSAPKLGVGDLRPRPAVRSQSRRTGVEALVEFGVRFLVVVEVSRWLG